MVSKFWKKGAKSEYFPSERSIHASFQQNPPRAENTGGYFAAHPPGGGFFPSFPPIIQHCFLKTFSPYLPSLAAIHPLCNQFSPKLRETYGTKSCRQSQLHFLFCS
jgi:hypothetical protein